MSSQAADVIIHGGDIITVDDDVPEAEAVAIADGMIIAVGALGEVASLKTATTKEINLDGQTLLPGFIESHTHPLLSTHLYYNCVDVRGFHGETKADIWAKLRAAVAQTEKGRWILCHGWNAVLVDGLGNPTRRELDDLTSDHPIVIGSFHGHSAFCNTMGFERSGIKVQDDSPKDDGFVRDSKGFLTGMALEMPNHAASRIVMSLPSIGQEQGRSLLLRQLDDYARNGFTTIAALGMFDLFKESIATLAEYVESPECPVRAVIFDHFRELKRTKKAHERGTPGRDRFCRVGVKWLVDGSPYSGTMATAEPYLDTSMTKDILHFPPYPSRGISAYPDDDMFNEMLPYHQEGWQLATHSHGERAVDHVLNTYERLLRAHPMSDHRYRLEHCGLITRDQLHRAKELGVTPSFFMDHVHYFGRALRDGILGRERAERFMPLYDAQSLGHRWSLHSDSPCGGPLGIMRNIQTAVTRIMRKEAPGDEAEVLGGSQIVPLAAALRAYTINSAWQLRHDHLIGSITPGKLADFTTLSEDPRRVDPYELEEVKITGTYRNGKRISL